jgi:hypothetical protein
MTQVFVFFSQVIVPRINGVKASFKAGGSPRRRSVVLGIFTASLWGNHGLRRFGNRIGGPGVLPRFESNPSA